MLARHPKQGASDHQGCGVSPGIGVCLRWVCLSLLGCIAIAAGNDSLFSLQNSLKKRGSRSIGKTEKKPSVQVSAPHVRDTPWWRSGTPGLGARIKSGHGSTVPSQGFPAFQRSCTREGLMCWATLIVLNCSLVSFINGASVAGGFNPLRVDCSKDLKDLGFYISKLLLPLGCSCCSRCPSYLRQQLSSRMAWESCGVWGS